MAKHFELIILLSRFAGFSSTMYIQNRRNSSKFNGCSPLQLHSGLISLKSAIAYFAYTKR